MKKRTLKLTLCAIFSALSVLMLFMASISPTAELGLSAVAAVFIAAAVIEAGVSWAAACFAISGLLSFLLLPEKSPAVFYVFFFGWYPILKCYAEKIQSAFISWLVKIAGCNAGLIVITLLFSASVFKISFFEQHVWLLFLFANIAFVVYDFGLSGLIYYYYHIKKSRRD